MAERIENMNSCLAGCIIASLLGLFLMLTFDSPWLAVLSAATIPPIACWTAGITNGPQLAKISAYAGVGWMLGFMLQPVVVRSAASRAAWIAEQPLAGNEWHFQACLVSTLLALIGAYFIPCKAGKQLQER